MGEWYSNLPAVLMTQHELTQGIARVQEGPKVVEIEPWVRERAGTMTFYREDAEVLRYLADVLESFDVARPEEADDEEDEQATLELKPAEPNDKAGEPKKPQIVSGSAATPELNAFALK